MSKQNYETDILQLLSKHESDEKSKLPLTTGEIAEKIDVNRNAVSKYLNQMEDEGRVGYEEKGPTKFWYIVSNEKFILKRLGQTNRILNEIQEIAPDYLSSDLKGISDEIYTAAKKFIDNCIEDNLIDGIEKLQEEFGTKIE